MTRKAFQPYDKKQAVSVLRDRVSCFVPEMSLPIKDILEQFSYVDNLRLSERMAIGYNMTDSDDDFDSPEFDQMDIAEKHELAQKSHITIKKYREMMKKKSQESDKIPQNT